MVHQFAPGATTHGGDRRQVRETPNGVRLVPITAQALLEAVKGDSEADYKSVVEELRAGPREAVALLKEVSGHPDRDVREWLATNATVILGGASTPILLALADDRDPEVRDIAMEELVKTDPSAAKQLAARYRRKLNGKEFYDAVQAMWALAAIRDTSAVDEIRAAGDRERKAGKLFVGVTAEIVCSFLEGRYDEIVRRIRAHEHDAMAALTNAARLIGTPEARAALAECARSVDAECRGLCQSALRSLGG